MAGRLAVIVAHPDDDTFACAGTVSLHADDPSFRFVLVHATSGEAGQIAEGSGATRETLGSIREEEDRRSWITLGREPDRHEWLRYQDHRLEEVPFDELVDRVAAILAEERPDVVLTFGPDGITGHPDHIVIGRATTEAFHRIRADGAPGLQRLLHAVIPQTTIDAWNRSMVEAGQEPFDPTELYHPRGVPDELVGVDGDTISMAGRVLEALREHRTQADDMPDWSDEEQLASLAHERSLIAWPERAPRDPVLRDVFEGLG
jgi:LmbE family N-acetylglucosaminyl deacetylase